MPVDIRELVRHVDGIRIVTSRLVDEQVGGEYQSVFKGHGIEFDEVRDYVEGDDSRAIDWNVTARMGRPFVRRYREERQLTVLFVVDVSGSLCFGSGSRSKSDLAAEVTSLLALSALRNHDRVGLVLFSDRIERCLPPRRGRTAAMRLVREVLAAGETRRGTDIAGALRFLSGIQKRRAVVFLISDFQDDGYGKELRVAARRHDLVCLRLSDPREGVLIDAGLLDAIDPETGARMCLDTASRRVRRDARTAMARREQALLDQHARLGVDTVLLDTSRDFVGDIRRLFLRRRRRAGRGR